MKWLIFAVLFLSTPSFAADSREILHFKNNVTFTHANHQKRLKGECKNCHRREVGGGKIDEFGKDVAHRLCRTCHAMRGGPAACKDCHKK